jgi:hypothetical protein
MMKLNVKPRLNRSTTSSIPPVAGKAGAIGWSFLTLSLGMSLLLSPTAYAEHADRLSTIQHIEQPWPRLQLQGEQLTSIAHHPTWALLLHSWQGDAQIHAPEFLLSAADFSLERELQATLALFSQQPATAFCRFPARITFIAQQLEITLPSERFQPCAELQRYRDYVPFTSMELVFASEVLDSTTSMLGHVFLKASGVNHRGTAVAHSLAYFAEIPPYNPARLMFASTVTGLPGYYIVRPFATDKRQYVQKEQRNLWQFALKATDAQKELLQLHLWELRNLDITYYFQSFNCATLTLELLALLDPAVLETRRLFVSPHDVVKAAHQAELVKTTDVLYADPWLFAALQQQLPSEQRQQLDAMVLQRVDSGAGDNAITWPEDIVEPALAARYLTLASADAQRRGRLSAAQHAQLLSTIPPSAHRAIQLEDDKSPAKTPQDSMLGLGMQRIADAGEPVWHLKFLGSGHYLYGDNRQYQTESELQIAGIALGYDALTQRTQLHELTLYSMKSYVPHQSLYPQWSSEFYAGYQPIVQSDLRMDYAGEVSGALGKSWRWHADVMAFVMVGGGLSVPQWQQSYTFALAKTGFIINLPANLKWISQLEVNSGKSQSRQAYQEWRQQLSWFPVQDQALTLGVVQLRNQDKHIDLYQAQWQYFF